MKIHKNRLLIVGSGNIFKKHISVLNNLTDRYEIVGIVEKNLKKLSKLKKKFKYQIFSNVDKAIKNSRFDLGCILTESGSHAELAFKFLNNKKSIIVEKPISISLRDAKKIVELENKNRKLRIFVVKQYRFNLAIQKLKSAVDKQKLGKIFLATVRVRWKRDHKYYKSASWRGTWKNDGGVLCNQAIHHIDLLQWLVGEVESVFCSSNTVLAPIESEDTAVGILNFKNKAIGNIEATTAVRPDNIEGSITLMGTKGTVIIGGFSADKVNLWRIIKSKNYNEKELIKLENPKKVYAYSHQKFYEYVFKNLKNRNKNFLNAKEAIKSLKIVTALVKSSSSKKLVKLSENLFNTKLGKKN